MALRVQQNIDAVDKSHIAEMNNYPYVQKHVRINLKRRGRHITQYITCMSQPPSRLFGDQNFKKYKNTFDKFCRHSNNYI